MSSFAKFKVKQLTESGLLKCLPPRVKRPRVARESMCSTFYQSFSFHFVNFKKKDNVICQSIIVNCYAGMSLMCVSVVKKHFAH